MSEPTHISDLLPEYISGGLDRRQRSAVETHLSGCPECQADLALWKITAAEIGAAGRAVEAPRGLADAALTRIRGAAPTGQVSRETSGSEPTGFETAGNTQDRGKQLPFYKALHRAWLLLRSQAALVQHEIWPSSAAVIALGYIAVLITAHTGFIYALAPLIAATCVSLIMGPDNDPGCELALSTPTSPRQILLARLALVFGYNLVLVLVASLGLLPFLPQTLLGTLVLAWLGPMTFLSAAALLLSLWIGTPNAITLSYLAWLFQLMAGPLRSPQSTLQLSQASLEFLAAYQSFWQSPFLLFGLALALFTAAVWLAGRRRFGMIRLA